MIMTESDLLKTLTTPGAMALAILWLHTRLNRIEDRHDQLAAHFGIPIRKRQAKWRNSILPVMAIGLSCLGCARFTTTMRETSSDGTMRETSVRVMAVGDTKQVIENLKVTHGKTQGMGAGLNQEGTTTNALRALEFLRDIAVSLPK
jgi:hypothetical protein